MPTTSALFTGNYIVFVDQNGCQAISVLPTEATLCSVEASMRLKIFLFMFQFAAWVPTLAAETVYITTETKEQTGSCPVGWFKLSERPAPMQGAMISRCAREVKLADDAYVTQVQQGKFDQLNKELESTQSAVLTNMKLLSDAVDALTKRLDAMEKLGAAKGP